MGNFHDFGSDIYVDGSGNVYVVGTCQNAVPNADFLVVKYNSSGVQQWINIYNYAAANLDDAAVRIKSATAGKITVAGVIQGTANTYGYGHLSYNTSTGAIIGSLYMGASSTDIEREFAYTKDDDGNTYIAGAINNGVGYGFDYCVIKFDTSAAIVWEKHYNGADGLEDIATDVAVDGDGNVYVTGYTTTATAGTNYTTLKYNPAGTQVWERHYDGIGNGADTAMAITMHSDTTFVITGSSFNGSNQDYYTIKYDTTGTLLWEINYNSYYNKSDAAYCIAVDTLNAIIVTGQSYNDTAFSFTTVKYIDPYINDTLPDAVPVSAAFSFTENRGQVIDTDTLPVPGIKFYNNQQEYSSYFTDTLISYVFAHIDTTLATDDTLFRVDMRFVDPLAGAKVYGMHKKADYANYYLPQTAPKGRERVPNYGQLYMPSLWTNIDLMINSNPAGIKYAFILNPGFDPEKPLLMFEGADGLYIDSDDLIVETELGNLVFPQATVFQIETDGSYSALAWQPDYYINSDIASFTNYGSYDSGLPLVIVIENSYAAAGGSDNLTWSTHYGGNGVLNVAYTTVVDDFNNIYVGGFAPQGNFPVTNGAFQTQATDDTNGALLKFNNLRQRVWATFFGGDEADEIRSMEFYNDKLYCTGYTFSSNFPTVYLGGATNDNSQNGNSDCFISSIHPNNGYPEWSSFIGGAYDDRGYSLSSTSSNLYLSGICGSGFPTQTSGSAFIQSTYGGGDYDGFLCMFDVSNHLEWSTFYGGSDADYAMSCKADEDGNLYVWGTTYSSNFNTVNHSGAQYQGTLAGNSDFFILRFIDNDLTWSTFYGDSDYEYAAENDGIVITPDNVYCVGTTSSSSMLTQPFGSNSFQATYGGVNDIFIVGFDITSDGLVWATYVGGNDLDQGEAITSTQFGNIIITGTTKSTDYPTQTITNGYSQSYAGSTNWQLGDAFITSFDGSELGMTWSTYVGGGSSFSSYGGDIGYGLSNYNDQSLFLVGATGTDNPSYPVQTPGNGAYYQPVNAGYVNMVISEFDLTSVVLGEIEYSNFENGFVTIYPNPTNDNLFIKFDDRFKNNSFQVKCIDISGKVVYLNNFHSLNNALIDVKRLSKGIYILELTDLIGNNILNQKFIKQ